MKNRTLIALIALTSFLISGGVFIASQKPAASCVTVYVDYGVLEAHKTTTECVRTDGTLRGMDALNMAGVAILGTEKYGLQIACRVNGVPDALTPIPATGHEGYLEKCKDMPAEFAYWAIIVRDGSNPWGWAQTGLLDIKLKPGDSIGLVYAINENVRFPN